MNLKPTYKIYIGLFKFEHTNEVRINHDRRTLTDTASIKMPMKYSSDQLNDVIKVDDEVKIWLAYDGEFRTEPDFQGYVSAKQPGYPFQIDCQDEMYQLKKKRVASKTFVKQSLKSVLEYLVSEAIIEVPEVVPGQFIVDGSKTISKHLESIKKTFGFDIYFRQNKLVIGLPYTDQNTIGKSVSYHLQKNIVSHSLRYVSKEDVIMRIKAVSTLPDGSKKEYYVGDEEGKTETMSIPDISLDALKILADEKLNHTKHDGLQGNITAFGIPYVEHGWIAKINDEWFDLAGTYFADAVTTVSGINGYRNIVTLGRSAK